MARIEEENISGLGYETMAVTHIYFIPYRTYMYDKCFLRTDGSDTKWLDREEKRSEKLFYSNTNLENSHPLIGTCARMK